MILLVCDKRLIFEIFKIFELYGRVFGVKINVQKFEIMCIGLGRLLEDERKLINVIEINVMKIFGVYFGRNKEECENLNWRNKV